MNKWLKKLTKKDWKELHGLIFCDDVTKVKTDKDCEEISFWENWSDGETSDYIETRYEYHDFEIPKSWDCGEMDYETRCLFFDYMIRKFGTKYLQELLMYRWCLPKETAERCKYE